MSIHKTWKIVEKGESSPLLEIRLGEGQWLLHLLRHPLDPNRRFMWYDRDGNVVAIEHRTVYTRAFRFRSALEQAMEQSKPDYDSLADIEHMPTLEILVLPEEKMEALMVAVWIARIWQESGWYHPTTMKRRISSSY